MYSNYQAYFQQRWPHLNHPHVRSLAWLLDSPSLLNAQCWRWNNQLVQLPPVDQTVANWLSDLEKKPQALVDYLAVRSHTRLGNYAENLLAFYFLWLGKLAGHRIQVRSHKTIGEFDFLLKSPNGLEHWEFACKYYLFVAPQSKLADYVGPGLTDNLANKSNKIMYAQLRLSQHPSAKAYLPGPVTAAKALVQGWLFYPSVDSKPLPEINPAHCRGLWCRLGDLEKLIGPQIKGGYFSILSRLQWLAPAKVSQNDAINFGQLQTNLQQLFLSDPRPVLVAQLVNVATFFVECERIFVVPDEWHSPDC